MPDKDRKDLDRFLSEMAGEYARHKTTEAAVRALRDMAPVIEEMAALHAKRQGLRKVGLSHNAAVELTAFYATSILNSKGGF